MTNLLRVVAGDFAKGRSAVAKENISAGSVVLEEYPALLAVDQSVKDLACATCLRLVTPGNTQRERENPALLVVDQGRQRPGLSHVLTA